jgi:hypothetical protein
MEHSYRVDARLRSLLDELSKIPDLEERLKAVLLADLGGEGPDAIYNRLAEAAIYLPPELTVTKPYNIDRFPVFRVRKNVDDDMENMALWRTFSYPSPIQCPYNGRANVARRPVFYASDTAGTALAESRPAVGEVFYLSEWLIRCHRSSVYAAVLPPLPKDNPWITIATNRAKQRRQHFQTEYGVELADKIDLIWRFLGDIFSSESPPYSVSSSLADHWLYQSGADYFIYPSHQTSKGTCNLAFTPNFVDEFFKLEIVYRLVVRALQPHGAVVEATHVGEHINNLIYWRLPTDDDLAFMPAVS